MAVVVLSVLSLLLLAYSILDVATSRPSEVRRLPKPLWFPVLLLPLAGPAAWWLAGRPLPGSGQAGSRPGNTAPSRSPDDDEVFLRQLRRRAQEQRRQAEEQQRRDGGAHDEDRPA